MINDKINNIVEEFKNLGYTLREVEEIGVKLTPRVEKLEKEGVLFPFERITKEEMLDLWVTLEKPDSAIAKLFEVPKGKVTKKRRELGVIDGEVIILQLERILKQVKLENVEDIE